MKKFFHVVLFTLICFSSIPLLASDLGFTVGLDYSSKSIWRGIYIYDKDGSFNPFISYDIFDTGLSLTVGSVLVDDYVLESKDNKTYRDSQLTEFCVDYSNKFGFVTLGAGFYYYRYWDNDFSYSESHVSLAFEDIPLSPTIIYTHDYYFSSKADKQGKDFYIQFGISHSFDLIEEVASLDLGAIAGYYKCSSWGDDLKGVSDIDLSVGLTFTHGAVEYSAGFHYVIVPSKDFYYNIYFDGTNKDISRFYSTFGASYSF